MPSAAPGGTEFSSDQFDRAYPDGIEHHWWSIARGRIVADVVRQAVDERAAILEVGCGRGIVVQALSAAGLKCRGVELAPVRPLEAVADRVRAGSDAAELPLAERLDYNALLLLDVIEHVAEPERFLGELAAAFPNIERAIVTVPARPELWSNYDEFYGHQARYTPAMLQGLAGNLEWRLERCGYFFHALYLPAWLLAKLGRNRPTRLQAPMGRTRTFHAVLAALMGLDYRLLPAGLPGTSLVGVFRV